MCRRSPDRHLPGRAPLAPAGSLLTMAYQSLYRRYRPRRFAEVRGQAQVVGALRNSVREDRVSHAYLFSGPRGTGKTSTARILAKALNCVDLDDGEPCGVCDSCVAIDAGTSYDLQELDAASNNKVDDIRDLIERVALGSPGRTKVYILDEVHMLSTGASNALLKTLEEPPAHVVFVLATTDPHKVLPTIRSRTQHFEFHLLPADELADHVRWVIGDAGLDVAADAVEHVLRQGGGSARDTLSALDQVAAAGSVGERGEEAEALVDAVCDGDVGLALRSVADAVTAGRDPRTLGEALLARLRDVFLLRMGASLDHVPDAERQRAAAWAERIGDRATTRALEEVGAALLEMRQAPDPRIPLEVALVRLTRPEAGTDLGALAARVERLEQTLAAAPPPAPSLAPPERPAPAPPSASPSPPSPPITPRTAGPARSAPPAPPAPAARPGDAARAALARSRPSSDPPASSNPPPAAEPAPPAAPLAAVPEPAPVPAPAPPAAPEGFPGRDALTLGWADAVLPRLGGLTKAMFAVGRFLAVEGERAVFALPNEVHRQKCAQKQAEVEDALASHFGRPVPLRLVVDGSTAEPSDGGAPDVLEEPDVVDVAHLPDAPAPRSDVDRLTEAFPGSQLLQEDT